MISPSLQSFGMASLCVIGGLMGYIRKRSKPSLIAGTIIGIAYGISGHLIETRQSYGYELALLTSFLLAGSMGVRGLKSGKPLPLFLSLLGLYNCFVYYEFNKL